MVGPPRLFLCWPFFLLSNSVSNGMVILTLSRFVRRCVQPKVTLLDPFLWVYGCNQGLPRFFKAFPTNNSSTKVNLDDRTVTASSPQDLYQLHQEWKHWSQKVGLLEKATKKLRSLPPSPLWLVRLRMSSRTIWSNGRSKPSGPCLLPVFRLCTRRKIVVSWMRVGLCLSLGCCNFRLDPHLRMVKQFAVPKVKYGWVARAPTWWACKQLFTDVWNSSQRVRYSSPWLCPLLHLVGSILRFRLRRGSAPQWTHRPGTCCGALRRWFQAKGFHEARGLSLGLGSRLCWGHC